MGTVLNNRQTENARSFYLSHKEHIDKLVSTTDKAYEPSQIEDKNDPRIWKAEYWKWFLSK